MIPVHRMIEYATVCHPLPPVVRLPVAELPITDRVLRRPVYERFLRRKHYMLPLGPPTEAEKRDAIRILSDTWEDELTEEAFRIFDEAGQ